MKSFDSSRFRTLSLNLLFQSEKESQQRQPLVNLVYADISTSVAYEFTAFTVL